MTQGELSDKSGVTQASISKIERGDQLRTTFAPLLAKALEIRSDWLSEGDGAMLDEQTARPLSARKYAGGPANKTRAEIEKLLDNADEQTLDRFRQLLDILAKDAADG